MQNKYTTKSGEKLDVICFKKYGYTAGSFESVLFDTKNYDLSDSEVFGAGVTIELPAITPTPQQTEYSLWD